MRLVNNAPFLYGPSMLILFENYRNTIHWANYRNFYRIVKFQCFLNPYPVCPLLIESLLWKQILVSRKKNVSQQIQSHVMFQKCDFCFLVCPPLENMARKQCFLVCPPLQNIAIGYNFSGFAHLRTRLVYA